MMRFISLACHLVLSALLLAQNDVSILLSGDQLLLQTTQEFRMDEGVLEEDAKTAADFWAKHNALTQAAKYFTLHPDKFNQPPSPDETELFINDLIHMKSDESKKIFKNNTHHLHRNLVLTISLSAMEHRMTMVRNRPLLKHAYEIDKLRRDNLLKIINRLQTGATPPAMDATRELLKKINATDWLNRGLANRELSNRLEYLNQALALDADYPFAVYQRGKTFYRLQRYMQAVTDFSALLENNENWLELHNLRGLSLGRLDRFNEAIADYNIVLESDPENQSALVNRGVALSHTGQPESAINDYKKALSLNADPQIIHYNMSCAYALMGESGKALKELENALSKGYHDFESIQADPDLEGLKTDPKFNELLEKYRELNIQ